MPGQIYNLTCPSSKDYYTHQGDSTTAEYYINNQGVDLADACSWGKDGTNRGNWAPTYLGAGEDLYGKTFVSIASTEQNFPTNHIPLNYTITLIGEGLSGNCRLKNDKYCSGDNYETCTSGPYAGCTVSIFVSLISAIDINCFHRLKLCMVPQRTSSRMIKPNAIPY